MISDLDNYMRQQMERNGRNYAEPRCATVTQFDASKMAAIVNVQPEDVATGWLPVSVDWMGNGWGFVAPLSVGDQVLVIFQEGDRDSGIIVKRLWDATNLPPSTGAAAGELWLVHKSGAIYKMTNDGNITLISSAEIDITAPSVKIGEGPYFFLVNSLFMAAYNAHTHDGSSPPVPLMTPNMITENLEAS